MEEFSKLEWSGLPPMLEARLTRFRFRSNRYAIGFILAAIGFLLFSLLLTQGKSKIVWPGFILAAIFYFFGMRRYTTRSQMLKAIEEATSPYGKVDEVLLDIEKGLANPIFSNVHAVMTNEWVITETMRNDYIIFPLELIVEVDVIRGVFRRRHPEPPQLYITFESGREILLADDFDKLASTYNALLEIFGRLNTSVRAFEELGLDPQDT